MRSEAFRRTRSARLSRSSETICSGLFRQVYWKLKERLNKKQKRDGLSGIPLTFLDQLGLARLMLFAHSHLP
jgi:hypothetical protein